MFSSRLRHGLSRNRLSLALERRRSANLPVVDLTESNPTRAGFAYPPDLLRMLGDEAARGYDPAPFGLAAARAAVSADFARRGVVVVPDRIVLTTSTSEAYSLLFKLLCDPGDTVLAPQPSYPLVEHLTDLDGVSLEPYKVELHGRWSIDTDGLRETIGALRESGRRVRAIIVISPNNPTGAILNAGEIGALAAFAREHDLALIADEVFADYAMSESQSPSALAQDDALTFGLGGLSKTAGLPQVKLGWIGVSGPDQLVAEALERLEAICDAYLSVSTPVQVAAADLLQTGADLRGQIRRRVRGNLERLQEIAAAHPWSTVLPVEGGWYGVVQVPAIESEETIVLDLLDRTGVLVHPGFFFDFAREAFLVISLLPEEATFMRGVETTLSAIGRAS